MGRGRREEGEVWESERRGSGRVREGERGKRRRKGERAGRGRERERRRERAGSESEMNRGRRIGRGRRGEYIRIYLQRPSYVSCTHIPSYTCIQFKIFKIMNMRTNIRPKNGHNSSYKAFPKVII